MAWSSSEVKVEVQKLVVRFAHPNQEVTESSRIIADLGMDSLAVMELISEVEDTFSLSIEDDRLREMNTVADVSKAIEVELKSSGRLVN